MKRHEEDWFMSVIAGILFILLLMLLVETWM